MFRPSESFLIPFLSEPSKNLTETEVSSWVCILRGVNFMGLKQGGRGYHSTYKKIKTLNSREPHPHRIYYIIELLLPPHSGKNVKQTLHMDEECFNFQSVEVSLNTQELLRSPLVLLHSPQNEVVLCLGIASEKPISCYKQDGKRKCNTILSRDDAQWKVHHRGNGAPMIITIVVLTVTKKHNIPENSCHFNNTASSKKKKKITPKLLRLCLCDTSVNKITTLPAIRIQHTFIYNMQGKP